MKHENRVSFHSKERYFNGKLVRTNWNSPQQQRKKFSREIITGELEFTPTAKKDILMENYQPMQILLKK
ncbi:MAG TPA: hypothetical protein VLZ83_13695 [Edaphocola sp.]|nr:hypothetical protein [Edaphocola sp.]